MELSGLPPLRSGLAREWYDDRNNVVTLLRWLERREEITTVSQAIDLVEKPWKWTPEWRHMIARLQQALDDVSHPGEPEDPPSILMAFVIQTRCPDADEPWCDRAGAQIERLARRMFATEGVDSEEAARLVRREGGRTVQVLAYRGPEPHEVAA
jgi:hypothetical protein